MDRGNPCVECTRPLFRGGRENWREAKNGEREKETNLTILVIKMGNKN